MTNLGRDVFADVTIVHVKERLAIVVRKSIPFADMPGAQKEARAILQAELAAANVEPEAGHLTVWRPPQNGVIDYAPGRFVAEKFAVTRGASFLSLPEGRAAHLRLKGAYSQLPHAWQHLFDFCRAQNLQLAGLNCEVYAPEGAASETPQSDLYAFLA
jgi:effector-binding domain-containing protein